MPARPRVLLVAPDFGCATGMTPALVGRHGRRFAYRLFPARDARFRRRSLRRELAAADLVHWHANLAHFPEVVAEMGHLPARVRQVATVHHLDEGDGYILDAVIGVDRLHAPSETTATAVWAHHPGVEVAVVPYVLDPAPPPRKRPHAPDWVVGWCGNATELDGRKRLGTLIEALARLPDLRPTLALQGFVAPEVAAAARAAGLTVREHPTRSWAQRWTFYDDLDVYCSPSRVEGGPLPVFEAAAMAVPVVTSRVGMAAALLDGGGAWAGDPDDPEQLAEALRAVLDAPPEERAARQDAAASVIASFGPTPGIPRYEALYADVLGIGPPAERRPAIQPRVELERDRRRTTVVHYRNARTTLHRLGRGADATPYPRNPTP